MRRTTPFPFCMLMLGFAVAIGLGHQPATAQEGPAEQATPEPEADVDAADAAPPANPDDAAPSPSDVGGNVPPPPASETTAEAAAQSDPLEGTMMEGEVAGVGASEPAVVEGNDRGTIVDEVVPCPEPAPVCCQPAPPCYYPRQQSCHSSGGFLHRLMGR